jgi:hypothetical protein
MAKGERATRDGGPYQIRIWWPHGRGGYGYATRGDSDIKTPYDIKPGTKVAHLSFLGETGMNFMRPLLAWAQLDEEDVVLVPAGTIDANTHFLMEGKADIALGFPISPIWVEAEAGPSGLSWIELDAAADPEGAARFLAANPVARFGQYGKQGVESAHDVWMIATLPRYDIHAEEDTELVYNMVKWLIDNHDTYKDAHAYCKFMTVDELMELAETDYVPLHDGVVKYLEEKGLWTPAHEARRQQQIDVITQYIEAYQNAIDMADDKGINVDAADEEWLDLWENYRDSLGLPGFKFFTGLD